MPSKADDAYFGGKPGASRKAWESMVAHYGLTKAQSVYHATLNRNRRLKERKRGRQR